MISSHFDLDSQQFHLVPATTTGYKSLPSYHVPPKPPSVLSSAKWKRLWSLRIPLNARNAWFRILHNKVATRDILHERQPHIHHPFYKICHSSTESLEHFLFACPHKRSFWSSALSTSMPPPLISQNSYQNFQKFLLSEHNPSRQDHSIYLDLSAYQVFACMLQTIWYHHYQFTFQDKPFLPSLLLSSLRSSLNTLHFQETLDQSS